jgi:hypothetical protein
MGTSTIFYLLSVLLSLYCAYLTAFRTYKMEFDTNKGDYVPTDERISYPRLVYILLIALSFAPFANVMLSIAFFVLSFAGRNVGDFYVKSWLLERPEEKEKKEQD